MKCKKTKMDGRGKKKKTQTVSLQREMGVAEVINLTEEHGKSKDGIESWR